MTVLQQAWVDEPAHHVVWAAGAFDWPWPRSGVCVRFGSMGSGPPSGTVTFLFTDVVGSTALWERAPEEIRRAVVRHDVVLRTVIDEHGGYVFAIAATGSRQRSPGPVTRSAPPSPAEGCADGRFVADIALSLHRPRPRRAAGSASARWRRGSSVHGRGPRRRTRRRHGRRRSGGGRRRRHRCTSSRRRVRCRSRGDRTRGRASSETAEALVSWRHSTSGRARARKRSTAGSRARSEFRFHVATRS